MYTYFRTQGNGRKLSWGRLRWEIRKKSFPRGWWGIEEAPQGRGHSSKPV